MKTQFRSSGRLTRSLWYRLRRDDGQVFVLWGLVLVVVLGVAGLGVNLGVVYLKKGQLQSAVDAAALAGAQAAMHGAGVSSESDLITRNAPGASGSVSIQPSNPSNVQAIASQEVNGGFATLFGFPHFNISARAVADHVPGQAFDYAVFQGSKSGTLTMKGNIQISGNVHSNYNVDLVGATRVSGNVSAVNSASGGRVSGTEAGNQPYVPTPQWPMPAVPPTSSFAVVSTANNLDITSNVPGSILVKNGYSLTVSGNSTINGDVYVVGGGSVKISSGCVINGSVIVEQGSSSSTVEFDGGTINGHILVQGSNISIAGNVSGDTSNGIAIGDYAYNGSGGNIDLAGTGTFTGVLYAPNGSVTMHGHKDVVGSVVADTVLMGGDNQVSYNSAVVDSSPFQNIALIQ